MLNIRSFDPLPGLSVLILNMILGLGSMEQGLSLNAGMSAPAIAGRVPRHARQPTGSKVLSIFVEKNWDNDDWEGGCVPD